MHNFQVSVIGAGLAGSQAALTLAKYGIKVKLYDMKPSKLSPAHKSKNFAELVCSNSLKSKRLSSASGLLKTEAKMLATSLFEIAEINSVEAGDALAVDRELFSSSITEMIKSNPLIECIEEEVKSITDDYTIIATGPLTSDELMTNISKNIGSENLYFFDAAAPIIAKDSINFDKVFFASRYKENEGAYLNCPFEKEEYINFYNELVSAETALIHDFERKKLFNACMPIEEIAKTGINSMRFGPLKPVGLTDPKTNRKPYACVQLRKENSNGDLWNIVGFQTRLLFPEQRRVFRMIPGLENAEFCRYGVMHRNNFINSPKILNKNLSAKFNDKIFFAGQITGLEGYVLAIISGHLAALNIIAKINGRESIILPKHTMIGALMEYITSDNYNFQPIAANFGILEPLPDRVKDKKLRYSLLAKRSILALYDFIKDLTSEQMKQYDLIDWYECEKIIEYINGNEKY